MTRVMIVIGGFTGVPAILLREAIKVLAHRNDLKLVAVCALQIPTLSVTLGAYLKAKALSAAVTLFNPAPRSQRAIPLPFAPVRWARKYDFEWIVPPQGDINHPDFIAYLRREIKPAIALSFYWLQKISPDLLSVFDRAVNYHNGALPSYRGIRATSWSIYYGERLTGFSFHYMNEKLDDGPILLEGTEPIQAGSSAVDLELAKAAAAARCIPRLLQMLVEKFPGEPQRGNIGFHSRRDYLSITTISDPLALSQEEITRRLRAFGNLQIQIDDTWYDVTKVRRISDYEGSRQGISFKTSDGIELQITRFRYVPHIVYKMISGYKKYCVGSARRFE